MRGDGPMLSPCLFFMNIIGVGITDAMSTYLIMHTNSIPVTFGYKIILAPNQKAIMQDTNGAHPLTN